MKSTTPNLAKMSKVDFSIHLAWNGDTETRSDQTGKHSSGLAGQEVSKTTSGSWCGTWHDVAPPSSGAHASNVRYFLSWCVTTFPLTLKPVGIGH